MAALALVVLASTVGAGVASDTGADGSTPRLDTADSQNGPSAVSAARNQEVTTTQNQGATTGDQEGTTAGTQDGAATGNQQGTTPGDQTAAPGNASRFEVVEVSSNVGVGESGNLTITIENVGDEALRDATVTLGSMGPGVGVGVGDGPTTSYVGTWDPGENETVSVEVTVPPDSERRRYAIEAQVTYRTGTDERRRAASVVTGFTPAPEMDFDVFAESTSLRVGETGTLRGELSNEGPRSIDDAVLVLVGTGNASGLVRPIDNEYYLGDIDSREDREFEFDVEVSPEVRAGRKQFTFRVEYRDEDDRVQQSQPLYEDWIVRERRDRFELENVETTLRVDDDGQVTGQIRNRGDEAVSNAVLRLVDPGANATGSLSATDVEYAVGDLEPNETTNFSFEIDASSDAVAGPRQLTFQVQYVDEDGQTSRSDPFYARIDIGAEREVFELRPLESSIQAGSTGTVRIEVTNVGDEPLTDVSAKLFVDDPLSADNDEAFVPQLGPNESANLTFQVSVAGDAIAKVYPLSVDFEYEEPDGDVKLSETYEVGLEVRESEGGGFFGLPFVIGGFLLVTVLGLAVGVRR